MDVAQKNEINYCMGNFNWSIHGILYLFIFILFIYCKTHSI